MTGVRNSSSRNSCVHTLFLLRNRKLSTQPGMWSSAPGR